jgi:hypothetical protein
MELWYAGKSLISGVLDRSFVVGFSGNIAGHLLGRVC